MTTPNGATRRINRGSGHSYEVDGLPVAGVTSILDGGIPKGGLIKWAGDVTAAYAVDNWEALALEPPAARLKTLERCRYEKKTAAAARGTKIHEVAARLIDGDEVDVPDALRDPVDQCLAFLAAWDIREVAVEVAVVNRTYRYAGTADLLARVGDDLDVWLFDWKTGAGGIWPEVALQLAAYAHAETMLVDGPDGTPGGAEITMPRIARAAAVAIRSDHYEVVPVDISDGTFRTFLYAQQIAEFAGRDRSEYVGEPLEAPMFAPALEVAP